MTAAPPLDKAAIATRIPHAGAMRLLDAALAWEREWIVCRTGCHRDPANPLRNASGLPTSAGIEIAAQAVALHASLTGIERQPRRGFLAVINNVSWTRPRLDDVAGDLEVRAEQLAATGAALQYAVTLTGDGQVLLMGEFMVALQPA
jgi:predicted hotdog family 3-hydroxylacyl-ACP dehydratase